MDRYPHIMGGNFRCGLNLEVVTFSTRLAVQRSPLHKSNRKRRDGSFHILYEALDDRDLLIF